MLASLVLMGLAAAQSSQTVSYDVLVQGQKVGSREVVVRHGLGADGTARVIESVMKISGTRLAVDQRWTAHVEGRSPASVNSVVELAGKPLEVQARWTSGGWLVSTNTAGTARTKEVPLSRIDMSAADLFDPYTVRPLSKFSTLRLLSTETGEIGTGTVEALGTKDLPIAGTPVPATGFAWDSADGRSVYWFNGEGYVVRYEQNLLGIPLIVQLNAPPPPGVDDFAVRGLAPQVEVVDL